MSTSNGTPTLNKENAVAVLINSVRLGQNNGAFLIQEVSLLKKAIDFFNKDVTEKPTFNSTENPEIVAINLLIQACQKVNTTSKNPLSIDDAALIFDCFEFFVKEYGSGAVANTESSKPSAKAVASTLQKHEEVEEEEEEPRERLITVKGKQRAV